MKRKKIVWTIAILIIGTPIFLIFMTFSNSTDCSQLVIDTYEIHSGIDIPKVEFVNCYYDENSKTRISVYDLDSYFDLKQFEIFNSKSQTEVLHGISLLEDNELPKNEYLYLASGEKWGTKWTYLVDRKTQRL